MESVSLSTDPGLFFPHLMMGQRDLQIFPLYGQQKNSGSFGGPLFPSNGILSLISAIGFDGGGTNFSAGGATGVTGTSPGNATTLSAQANAGATSVTVASATGYATNGYVQIDTNANGVSTTECRKITNVVSTTLTLDTALTYTHSSGAAVHTVSAPFTHTIVQGNTLPSMTIEQNTGGYQSLQYFGCRSDKFSMKAAVGDSALSYTSDITAMGVNVLATPTPISGVTSESPYVFAEGTISFGGQTLAQCTNVEIDIENSIKGTYTFNQSHNLQFLTPISRKVSGKLDVVWTSFNDATWGYFNQMLPTAGTQFVLSATFAHPGTGGSVTFTMPQVNISKYADDIKMEDVIITSLNYEASMQVSTTSTINSTIVNSAWLAY